MTERRTVFGAGSENVRQFLNDCLSEAPSDSPPGKTPETAQLLQEQLAEKCPVPRAQPGPTAQGSRGPASWLMSRVQEKVLLDLSRSVGEVLSDSQANLDTLRDIKNRYKKWAEKATKKGVRHVYTALYFAAIARALVSHNRLISRYPAGYLAHSFQTLADEPWMAAPLKELYLQARRACERPA